MTSILLPTTREIQEFFTTEINELGGNLLKTFEDGHRLFLRATLPRTAEVAPRDSVQNGIAIRTHDRNLLVHPYVFRKVCRNGAIWAQATDSFGVERVDFSASNERIEAVYESIHTAVVACVSGNSFQRALGQMRIAADSPGDIDRLLEMIAELESVDGPARDLIMDRIISRYHADHDRSQFGLMNAVTSVARDTADQETKWQLEELGGGVPALVRPTPKPTSDAAVAELIA